MVKTLMWWQPTALRLSAHVENSSITLSWAAALSICAGRTALITFLLTSLVLYLVQVWEGVFIEPTVPTSGLPTLLFVIKVVTIKDLLQILHSNLLDFLVSAN